MKPLTKLDALRECYFRGECSQQAKDTHPTSRFSESEERDSSAHQPETKLPTNAQGRFYLFLSDSQTHLCHIQIPAVAEDHHSLLQLVNALLTCLIQCARIKIPVVSVQERKNPRRQH